MKNKFWSLEKRIYKLFLIIPVLNRWSSLWYSKLGINFSTNARIYGDLKVIGDYSNIFIGENAEITNSCFLLAKEKIKIGKNSTLAYQATILTSAYPNGPYNELVKLYPRKELPVIIGMNSWIGARSLILPGVTIGDFCVVAAGSIVTANVPNYTVVGGVPAKEIKKLDPKMFE